MPYIQNEDGELFSSNVLPFAPNLESFDDSDNEEVDFPVTNVAELDHEPNEEDVLNDLFPDAVQSDVNERTYATELIGLPPQRRCVSHLLNLVSADFEKMLGKQTKTALINAINKVHGLWTFTHQSCQAKTLCKEVLGCILEVPCVTRWNSRFDAVSKVCRSDVKPNINRLTQRLSADIPSAGHLQVVSNADWVIMQEYVRVMERIATALDILKGEKRPVKGLFHQRLRQCATGLWNWKGTLYFKLSREQL